MHLGIVFGHVVLSSQSVVFLIANTILEHLDRGLVPVFIIETQFLAETSQ